MGSDSATPGQPKAFVGFTNNMVPARPANPLSQLDVEAADAWNKYYNNWFPNAVINGWVDANFDGIQTPTRYTPTSWTRSTSWDAVLRVPADAGLRRRPIPGFPFLKGLPVRCAAESPMCSDFDQPPDPGGFREVLEVAASYKFADGTQVPLWITENGSPTR